MARAHPHRPATYEDLLAVPEHLVAEIIDGELVTSPRPAAPHASAASLLGAELIGPFGRGRGGPGGWIILFEPELHVAGQILVPDLAGWRRERMPRVPEVAFFEFAPDWVCEVLSASTAKRDRTRKMHHYAAAGVSFLWFLDPGTRILETYRLDGDGWRHIASHANEDIVRAQPFDSVELALAALWAW
jgi:Uma2 family endonuclease